MKQLALILALLLPANAVLGADQQASIIRCTDADSKSEWERVAVDKRCDIEKHLLTSYGLSSTGQIELSGVYRLTHSDAIGAKGDVVALFTQEDLFGDRLFWICLVNLTKQESRLLYRVGGKDVGEVIRFQQRAEPGAPHERPPAAADQESTEDMNTERETEAPTDSGGQ